MSLLDATGTAQSVFSIMAGGKRARDPACGQAAHCDFRTIYCKQSDTLRVSAMMILFASQEPCWASAATASLSKKTSHGNY